MSRYRIRLVPQGVIPQDLAIGVTLAKAATAAVTTTAGCCNECGDGWAVTIDEETQTAADLYTLQNETPDPIAVRVEFLGTLCDGACIEWEARSLLNEPPLDEVVLTPDGCSAVDIAIAHSDVDLWGETWFGIYATINDEPICETLVFTTHVSELGCFAYVLPTEQVCFDPYDAATLSAVVGLTLQPGYEGLTPGDLTWTYQSAVGTAPSYLESHLTVTPNGGTIADGFTLTKDGTDFTDQPFYIDVTIEADAGVCDTSALFEPNDRIIATSYNSGAASDAVSGYFSQASFGSFYPSTSQVSPTTPWTITLTWAPRCDNSGGAALVSWAHFAGYASGAFNKSLDVNFFEGGDTLQIDATIPAEGDQSNLLNDIFVQATDVDGNVITYSFVIV